MCGGNGAHAFEKREQLLSRRPRRSGDARTTKADGIDGEQRTGELRRAPGGEAGRLPVMARKAPQGRARYARFEPVSSSGLRRRRWRSAGPAMRFRCLSLTSLLAFEGGKGPGGAHQGQLAAQPVSLEMNAECGGAFQNLVGRHDIAEALAGGDDAAAGRQFLAGPEFAKSLADCARRHRGA